MRAVLARGLVSALLCLGSLPFVGAKGCGAEDSADVNQTRIHTAYWLYVDGQADATYVRAQFRFGGPLGTALRLESPASVKVDAKAMGFNDLLSWHETTLAGEVDEAHLVYVNADGETFENHLGPARPLSAAGSGPLTIARNASFTLELDGEPLGANESVEVTVQSVASPLELQIFLEAEELADTVVLTQDKLDRLPAGAARIIVKRHSDATPSQVPEGGGKITVSYQAPDRAAVLE